MPCPPPWSISNNSEKSKHTAAVDIKLDFDFRVYEVDDIRYTVSFTMYFGVRWHEPRMITIGKANYSDALTAEPLNLDMLSYLWLPAIYVLNLKSYKTLDIFSQFAGIHN